jgi:hypothetical protein
LLAAGQVIAKVGHTNVTLAAAVGRRRRRVLAYLARGTEERLGTSVVGCRPNDGR